LVDLGHLAQRALDHWPRDEADEIDPEEAGG
jgi:hypothetical protein